MTAFRLQALAVWLLAPLATAGLAACSGPAATTAAAAPAPETISAGANTPDYVIGPGDTLQVFVWRNPDLTSTVPVRPDGRISIPLADDIQAAGKRPTDLSKEIQGALAKYIQEPIVTVVVTNFIGPFTQQVRVIGEAARPQAIPFSDNMSVLDVMVRVGGLTQFAAGNRAVLVRRVADHQENYRLRLDDLIRDGDVTANVAVKPGDILVIPQSWF